MDAADVVWIAALVFAIAWAWWWTVEQIVEASCEDDERQLMEEVVGPGPAEIDELLAQDPRR